MASRGFAARGKRCRLESESPVSWDGEKATVAATVEKQGFAAVDAMVSDLRDALPLPPQVVEKQKKMKNALEYAIEEMLRHSEQMQGLYSKVLTDDIFWKAIRSIVSRSRLTSSGSCFSRLLSYAKPLR